MLKNFLGGPGVSIIVMHCPKPRKWSVIVLILWLVLMPMGKCFSLPPSKVLPRVDFPTPFCPRSTILKKVTYILKDAYF